MNIIEAAKTGLPMQRKAWAEGVRIVFSDPLDIRDIGLSQTDITADDWEVDEPKVTITRRDLDKAWDDAGGSHSLSSTFVDAMARSLGL